jgi:phospholipid transport system substrate-binding protein
VTARKLISAFLGALAFAYLSAASAQEAPDVLVKTVTLEVVDLIAKDKEIRSGNRTKLIQVIDTKVLPHFNSPHDRARDGQNWAKANPEQKNS